jgi:hypothetical protein
VADVDTRITRLFAEVNALTPASDLWERAQAAASSAEGSAGRPRPARRRGVAVGIGAAAVAAAAVVVVVFGGSTVREPGSISAAQAAERACRGNGPPGPCLDALARVAAQAPAPTRFVYQRQLDVRSGPLRVVAERARAATPYFFHVRHLQGVTAPFTVYLVSPRELWIDRSTWHGAVRTLPARLWFPSPADRQAWLAAGSPSWTAMRGGDCCPLPTGTHWLRDARRLGMYRGFPDSSWGDPGLSSGERARHLHDMEANTALHPRLAGRLRDPLGRSGVVLRSWYAPNDRYHIDWIDLYDVRTTRLLAQGVVATGARLAPGNIDWTHVYTIPEAPAHQLPLRRGSAPTGPRP